MILQRQNITIKRLITNSIFFLICLILLIIFSLNWYWTNHDIFYNLKHYEDRDTRELFQLIYYVGTVTSSIMVIFCIVDTIYRIIINKDIEFKLTNDKLIINYNDFILNKIRKNFNINSKNHYNEINILEIKEIEIKSPNKFFKNCLFININSDEVFLLPGLDDPEGTKENIEKKIREIKKELKLEVETNISH